MPLFRTYAICVRFQPKVLVRNNIKLPPETRINFSFFMISICLEAIYFHLEKFVWIFLHIIFIFLFFPGHFFYTWFQGFFYVSMNARTCMYVWPSSFLLLLSTYTSLILFIFFFNFLSPTYIYFSRTFFRFCIFFLFYTQVVSLFNFFSLSVMNEYYKKRCPKKIRLVDRVISPWNWTLI